MHAVAENYIQTDTHTHTHSDTHTHTHTHTRGTATVTIIKRCSSIGIIQRTVYMYVCKTAQHEAHALIFLIILFFYYFYFIFLIYNYNSMQYRVTWYRAHNGWVNNSNMNTKSVSEQRKGTKVKQGANSYQKAHGPLTWLE